MLVVQISPNSGELFALNSRALAVHRGRRLPSELLQKHTWRTRPDPFADVWDEVEQF